VLAKKGDKVEQHLLRQLVLEYKLREEVEEIKGRVNSSLFKDANLEHAVSLKRKTGYLAR
jgi:hypothetical protein